MDASNHPFSRIRTAISISTLILLSGSAFAQSQHAPSLQLKAGTVNVSTLQNTKVRNEQRPQRMPDRMVIVLDSTMTPALRKQIAATGARIGDYLPDHA